MFGTIEMLCLSCASIYITSSSQALKKKSQIEDFFILFYVLGKVKIDR